jgi:nucleotide-binding universal stress UspA family protein
VELGVHISKMEVAMFAIKHILFPIDFSARTCGAAPFVQAMAERFGSQVTLLSAASPIPYSGIEVSAPMPFDSEDLRADLQARLDLALAKEFARVPVQRKAEIGDPADVITRFAHTQGVDLIMMPTHGYGPFRRLLLGSVTAKVLHDAQCPVWTGAHMEDPPAKEHLGLRTVLCAVDGTPKSTPAMHWAAQFSKDANATLRLVHVTPGVEPWLERQIDREFENELREEARGKIEGLARAVDVEAPLCVTSGDIAGGVREEALRHGADLVVIGRGVLDETLGRLRTHSYGIIRQAPCPVVSV